MGTVVAVSTDDLAGYLETGERVLWSGRPKRGIMFRAEDAFQVPFWTLWFSFALFWEASVLGLGVAGTDGAPIFFAIFGLPFILIGAYMAIGRFLWDADVRGQTLYALTNRRVVIFRRVPTRQFRSLGLTVGTEINMREWSDGSGTITFGPRITNPLWIGWPRTTVDDFTFERIQNVREALRVVRSVKKGGT